MFVRCGSHSATLSERLIQGGKGLWKGALADVFVCQGSPEAEAESRDPKIRFSSRLRDSQKHWVHRQHTCRLCECAAAPQFRHPSCTRLFGRVPGGLGLHMSVMASLVLDGWLRVAQRTLTLTRPPFGSTSSPVVRRWHAPASPTGGGFLPDGPIARVADPRVEEATFGPQEQRRRRRRRRGSWPLAGKLTSRRGMGGGRAGGISVGSRIGSCASLHR